MSARIYVACLASYNNGTLHGEWIDLADCSDGDELQERVNAMLAKSKEPGAEEWEIHDHEGFGNFKVENYKFDDLVKLANLIEKHGLEIVDYADECVSEVDEIEDYIDEHYRGEFESAADYVQQLLEESGDLSGLPENLRSYFDFEALARDMELNGEIYTIEAGYKQVYVFDR